MRFHARVRFGPSPDSRRARRIFGLGLRQGRISCGLSQRSLAALAGVHQSTISRLETGTAGGLRYETLMRILQGLQVVQVRFVGTPSFMRLGE